MGDGKTVEGVKQRCDRLSLAVELDYSGRYVGIRKLERNNKEGKGVHYQARAIQKKGQSYLLQQYLQG